MVKNKVADGAIVCRSAEYGKGPSSEYDLYEWKVSESRGVLGMWDGYFYDRGERLHKGL